MKTKKSLPWIMLPIRSVFFLAFQASIALIFVSVGSSDPWTSSAAWWPIAVILTDLVCLVLLVYLFTQEKKRFWDIFRIERQFIKKDLLFLIGFLAIAGPLGYIPNILSARWLFGDPQIALDLLVQPLPVWAAISSFVLFPPLQGLVEIPVYVIYSLQRLEVQGVKPWVAISLTSFFLSAQHIFVPFIPNMRFIIYRLIMFLPFAILITVVMRWRPRLMPYMVIIHILMDISIAVMFLFVMY